MFFVFVFIDCSFFVVCLFLFFGFFGDVGVVFFDVLCVGFCFFFGGVLFCMLILLIGCGLLVCWVCFGGLWFVVLWLVC